MNQLIEDPGTDDLAADAEILPIFRSAPRSVEYNKLRKRLVRLTREAIDKFGMVTPGQRWLVALSGGKDSYRLLAILLDLKWRGLLPVDLLACNLDQGQPNFPKHILPEYLTASRHRPSHRIPGHLFDRDGQAAGGATYCSLCSRLEARPPLPHRPRGEDARRWCWVTIARTASRRSS